MARNPENHTKSRQFRLSPETLELLDRIGRHYATDRTGAIRFAARDICDRLKLPAIEGWTDDDAKKKRGKNSIKNTTC